MLTRDEVRHETRMIDVSLTGIKIATVPGLAAGTLVRIDFGTGLVPATVVWANTSAAGLEFSTTFRVLPKVLGVDADDARQAA